MYWLSYEGNLFMGVESVSELLHVLRVLRAQHNRGKVSFTWVHIKGLNERTIK
jgi:hypothetical protein